MLTFCTIFIVLFFTINANIINYGLPFFQQEDENEFLKGTIYYINFITGIKNEQTAPFFGPLINLIITLKFLFINEIFASIKRSIISGVDVKSYKKERNHIETSALLCALAINGNSLEDIKKNLETTFKKPISRSDKFLINDVMSSMCPEFDNRKIFEN